MAAIFQRISKSLTIRRVSTVTCDVLDPKFPAAKIAPLHSLSCNVLEHVADKFDQDLLRHAVESRIFTLDNRQDVMIFLVIFNLLHQAHGLTIDNLSGPEQSFRQNETVHIQAVISGCIKDESVRKRIRARDSGGASESQSLLIMGILDEGAGLVLNKYFHFW